MPPRRGDEERRLLDSYRLFQLRVAARVAMPPACRSARPARERCYAFLSSVREAPRDASPRWFAAIYVYSRRATMIRRQRAGRRLPEQLLRFLR